MAQSNASKSRPNRQADRLVAAWRKALDHTAPEGDPPRVWNVPHQRSPRFYGRRALLAAIERDLGAGRRVALTQEERLVGAVGKTETAVEFAYQQHQHYKLVWWMRAGDPITLANDYAGLAAALGVSARKPVEQAVLVMALHRLLRREPSCLLIFDNARDPADLKPYLPPEGAGHVLITSRHVDWDGVAKARLVRPQRGESRHIVYSRLGRKDREAADYLAEVLDDIPLAMDLAAAYVRASGTSLDDYAELCLGHQRERLRRSAGTAGFLASVATAWELSLSRLQEESPLGAALLNLWSYLAPEEIPAALFGPEMLAQAAAKVVEKTDSAPEGRDVLLFLADSLGRPGAWDRALQVLRSYALCTGDDELLFMPLMGQAVTRDGLSAAERRLWARAALRLSGMGFCGELQDLRGTPGRSRLLSHVLHAALHANALAADPVMTVDALLVTGRFLHERAEHAQAKALLEPALQLAEKIFGPDHPRLAYPLANLGGVLEHLGDLAGAREHLQRALRLFQEHLGEDHPVTVQLREDLARITG